MNKIEVEQNGKNTILQIEEIENIKEIRLSFKDYKVEQMEVNFYKYGKRDLETN